VFRVGGDVSAPVVIYKVEPKYSEEARKAKYAGRVVLRLIVDATGKAQSIKVTRSLGLGLDENAIQARQ
jgi:periplasmic protein TonB